MAIVVSDSSPLYALSHLQYLELLPRFFDEVLIPPAVARELANPPSLLRAVEVAQVPFLRVRAPVDLQRVALFRRTLDSGESEALALAEEVQADAILIDEFDGRAMATQIGVEPVGALGVLLRGKEVGAVGLIAPLMDRLQNEIQFRISPQLREHVLRLARE